MKVLIVEDNEILARNLVRFLSLKNIASEMSFDGIEALYKANINFYDLIILDIHLPSLNGKDLCKKFRENGKTTPIIMLTSQSSKTDIIEGLELGADDYLVKPFDYEELVARMHALTRRNLKNKSNTKIYVWNYVIDLETIEVFKISRIDEKEEKIDFSNLEFNLLKYLVQNQGKVISRKELYEKVWGEFDEFLLSKTVDVYIGYLRKKLGKDFIETRKGFGYIIQ